MSVMMFASSGIVSNSREHVGRTALCELSRVLGLLLALSSLAQRNVIDILVAFSPIHQNDRNKCQTSVAVLTPKKAFFKGKLICFFLLKAE